MHTSIVSPPTAHELVTKNSNSLVRHLAEIEEPAAGEKGSGVLKEKLTLFKLTAGAMMKAADEFLLQATSTDRRWSRALQHEHSLRLEVQESMEAMANQMHGMEREARGMFSPQMSASSQGSSPQDSASVVSGDCPVPGIGRSHEVKVIPGGATGRVGEGRGEEGKEEEEEKFFDAPEISQEEWERAWKEVDSTSSFTPGHKRNVSTASVNEAQTLLSAPEPEHLPVCSERTMSVS